jgi:hypothetical protein
MAQHRLLLNAAQLELTSKDIEIVVFSNKERMGTLKVSKGSLDWRDKKDRKSHVARWEEFRQWIIGQNRRRLRRK